MSGGIFLVFGFSFRSVIITVVLRFLKKVLRGTFWKIRHIQIQIYTQTYIEPKYGAFYLKNKVSAHKSEILFKKMCQSVRVVEKVIQKYHSSSFCNKQKF